MIKIGFAMTSACRAAIGDAVEKTIDALSWAKEAKRYAGSGLGSGADVSVARRWLQHMRARGVFRQAAAAETVLDGGQWPQSRLRAIYPRVPELCPRCNMAPETLPHRYWCCAANATSADEAIQATQYLCAMAMTDLADNTNECLWLRALVPSHWTHASEARKGKAHYPHRHKWRKSVPPDELHTAIR